MEIKKEYLVKTYDLCTGEIAIGEIEHIFDKDVEITCWRGSDEFRYEDEKEFRKIPYNSIIWDQRNKRHVFKYWDDATACFSTVVVDVCPPEAAMWRFLVEGEKIKKNLY